jgi:ABC-2 type transport system permease protein
MSGVWTIARKELADLINSRLIVLILVWYVIVFGLTVYGDTYELNGHPAVISVTEDPVKLLFIHYTYSLCYYGTIVALVLGFSSMAAEMDGKALNTLLVKPLYRDTIINGKYLGVLCFVLCLFAFTTALYIAFMFVYYGLIVNSFNVLVSSYIPSFVGMIPLAFILSILCIMFFYSLSLVINLLIKEQSFALFSSLLAWIILFTVLNEEGFAGSIGYFLHDNVITDYISYLSPYTMLYFILGNTDISSVLANNGLEVLKLFLYCVVTIILSYIVFLRRDVA